MVTGIGYRSDYLVITKDIVAQPIFASYKLRTVIVLENFIILSPLGSYIYLDSVVNIPVRGTFNVTFVTYDNAEVTYITFTTLFFDPTEADLENRLIFDLGAVQLTSNLSLVQSFFNGILTRYI